jgi:putative membrane protein
MKLLMNLLIAGLLLNMGCNTRVTYEEALNENQDRFEDARQLEDAKFLVESKSRNLLAIKVLSLASDSGYSSVVVRFAKQSLPEHQQLDEELEELSKKKEIELPDELSAQHQMLLSELTSSARSNFDNTFSKIIGNINDQNYAMFTGNATEASDEDIRAFAARKLDLLRNHSRLLSTMQEQLLNTSE